MNYWIVGNLEPQNALHDFCDFLHFRQYKAGVDNIHSQAFTREIIFEAASQGKPACLTTYEFMISNSQAQNSQASRKDAVLCGLFITDNVLLYMLHTYVMYHVS